MSDEKLDLSALDPSRDPERWERLIARVSAHATAPRAPSPSIAFDLVRWGRPLMAAAALLAVATWVPAWLRERSAPVQPLTPTGLAEWAQSGAIPSNVDVLEGFDER
jgi:hypothetical protein